MFLSSYGQSHSSLLQLVVMESVLQDVPRVSSFPSRALFLPFCACQVQRLPGLRSQLVCRPCLRLHCVLLCPRTHRSSSLNLIGLISAWRLTAFDDTRSAYTPRRLCFPFLPPQLSPTPLMGLNGPPFCTSRLGSRSLSVISVPRAAHLP